MGESTFNGKTALIVGGTSGMGKATAKVLLEEGANVLVASNVQEHINEAVSELKSMGSIEGLKVDLRSLVSVGTFVTELQRIPEINYLVNTSGIFGPKPFLESTPEDYNSFIDINRGIYFITQAVAKKMKETGNGGAIVNIGSYWAKQAIKGSPTTAYSMAKAGIHAFTRQIAMELAEHKIRVNAIAPGVVETNVLNGLFKTSKEVKDAYRELNTIHPIGRNGQPEDIAATVKFLLSNS